MKEFIEYIVKNLVDHPDQVEVKCFETEKGLVVQLKVAPDEVGKVVGARGITINALRTIAVTVCARLGYRIRLELVQ